MLKCFKKSVLVTATAFVFLLAATSETSARLPLPSVTIGQEEGTETAPLPEESDIQPLADEDEDFTKVQ
ncbi:MAG: hypothetical protein ACI4FZ_01315 [Lachnospiraceae bacterium]